MVGSREGDIFLAKSLYLTLELKENINIYRGNIFQGITLYRIEVNCKIPGPHANLKSVSEEAPMLSLLDVHELIRLVSLEWEQIC